MNFLCRCLSLCRKIFQKDQTIKEKSLAAGHSDNKQMELTPWKCFRCGPEDHLIEKCPKPPKENEKRRKQVCFNEKVNRACDNSKNNSNQNIYTSMARMYGNYKCPSRKFGDSL